MEETVKQIALPKKKLPFFEIIILLAIGFSIYWGLLKGKSFSDGAEDVWAIVKTILGIGFLIFIHELGHFLAAKWCDVQVDTFAIGMGPTIPGCKFKRGETLYRLGWLPIGGYVKMLGQTDPGEKEDDPEGARNNPRSYMNKSVGQRMLIISAGVIMNLAFGFLVFILIYLNGKEDAAPIMGPIHPGLPADKLGIRAGSEILQVDQNEHPIYEDLFYAAALARADETKIFLRVRDPEGKEESFTVVPTKLGPKPAIGVGFPPGLRVLRDYRLAPDAKILPGEDPESPAQTGYPAARAHFRKNDLLLAVKGEDESEWTPFKNGFSYKLAEHKYRYKPMLIKVQRGSSSGSKEEIIKVEPGFMNTLGVHMGFAKVTCVSEKSPLIAEVQVGDVIESINKDANYDPLRLADLLFDVAEKGKSSELSIRKADGQMKTISVDPKHFKNRANWGEQNLGGLSLSIPPLGVAFQFDTIVRFVVPGSQAEKVGITPGDKPFEIKEFNTEGKEVNKVLFDKDFVWINMFLSCQIYTENSRQLTFVDPSGKQKTIEKFTPVPDPTWAWPERGLLLERGTFFIKAESISEAFHMGTRSFTRFIWRIYMNLHSLLRGDISVKMLAGPIRMAETVFAFAKRSFSEFVFFLAIISINLAVVNFLPIPVLDGGHMVLLFAEKIRGRKVNEKWLYYITLVGLVMVLGLMVLTFYVDISSFEWFKKLFPSLR